MFKAKQILNNVGTSSPSMYLLLGFDVAVCMCLVSLETERKWGSEENLQLL